ncbi:MAG: 30S ribosomal protein S13 [Phycisphaerae bacterium]|nr:30S ribosomal protein S13 [Phycisphaerae bacterium]
MPRIAGVDIPENKPIRIALRYIFGIGPGYADQIVKEVGLDGMTRSNKLSDEDLARITQAIDGTYVVEGALRRQVQQNVQRLKEIRSYRGDRHRRGLPVHGQRTRTNARTRKGKKRTVAGKKGVKAK